MQILNCDLSEIFLQRAADYRGVQRIPFPPLKPPKRRQNAETVLINLLTIFAAVRAALFVYPGVGLLPKIAR